MDLIPIANKLENEGLGTPGVDLFVNFMPMEAKNAILLRSRLYGTEINTELPGYYKCDFTVVVRTPEFTQGSTKMEEVMRILTIYEEQLEDIYIRQMFPRTLPIFYPISDGSLYEIQVDFEIVFIGKSYGR